MGVPPPTSIRLSLSAVKKPMEWLSGDQKGNTALSVPGRGCAVIESNGRTKSCVCPSAPAENTTYFPSGEIIAGPDVSPERLNCIFAGGLIDRRSMGNSFCPDIYTSTKAAMVVEPNTPAIPQAHTLDLRRARPRSATAL